MVHCETGEQLQLDAEDVPSAPEDVIYEWVKKAGRGRWAPARVCQSERAG